MIPCKTKYTKSLIRTVCKQTNKDAKTEALLDGRSTIKYISMPQPKDSFLFKFCMADVPDKI